MLITVEFINLSSENLHAIDKLTKKFQLEPTNLKINKLIIKDNVKYTLSARKECAEILFKNFKNFEKNSNFYLQELLVRFKLELFTLDKKEFIQDLLNFTKSQNDWEIIFITKNPFQILLKNNISGEKLGFAESLSEYFLDYSISNEKMPTFRSYLMKNQKLATSFITKELKTKLKYLDKENPSNRIFKLLNESLLY